MNIASFLTNGKLAIVRHCVICNYPLRIAELTAHEEICLKEYLAKLSARKDKE